MLRHTCRSVTTIDGVFKEAHQSFLRSLSPDERTLFSTCASAENLLADARQLEIISKNRTRGRRFMQRITAISKTLVPYFEVVGITVQTTEYAALAWGGIRLILQVVKTLQKSSPIRFMMETASQQLYNLLR